MTNISRLHFAQLPMPIETLPRLPRLWADHVCYRARRPNRAPLWRRHGYVQANASAMRAMRFVRLDIVDRSWRRQLTALPFRARQPSRNRPVRLDQSFSEDRRRALLVAGGDPMQLRPPPPAQPLPSERTHLHTPTRLEP